MQAIRILAAAALVFVASTAAAQGGGGGGQGGMGQGGAARMNEMLFKGITLTDAQKAKVDSIQAHAREQMMSMDRSDPAVREKMTEMRAKQNKDIREVLTADQQAIFDKNLAEMPQGGGRRPPPPR
ncbi:MAG: Spy/CpxP family protein refolding chaperone [Gemmatimonadota bacterium]|nr:Spy/CpxP family protein refolding chaperone [Gemmatimonadota bacterium]